MGQTVLLNQKEVLEALTVHKGNPRFVDPAIEGGDPAEIEKLANALRTWLSQQTVENEKRDDGSIKERMGKETKDIFFLAARSPFFNLFKRIKENVDVTEKYVPENYDLIVWFVVS